VKDFRQAAAQLLAIVESGMVDGLPPDAVREQLGNIVRSVQVEALTEFLAALAPFEEVDGAAREVTLVDPPLATIRAGVEHRLARLRQGLVA
jgi:hypothetical protein